MSPRVLFPQFFVDETMLGVGRALALLRNDVLHPGHRELPGVPIGSLDPDWMPQIAAQGLVVISRDRHIATKPAELELFRRHGLRGFWISGSKDPPLSSWVYLRRLVKHWDTIEHIVAERGPGPWFCSIRETRVTDIKLRER